MAYQIAVSRVTSLAFALALSGPVACKPANAEDGTKPSPAPHVYVFTGFGGAGKSYIDGVADTIRKRKIPTTVSPPAEWPAVAASVIESYKAGRLRSIIAVGYSMGGGAAMNMAAQLGRAHVPVQLVLTVDPVGVPEISPNIRRLINYYVPHGVSGPIPPSKSFHGILRNVEEKNWEPLGHFSIAFARERELIDLVTSVARASPALEVSTQTTGATSQGR